MPETVRTGVEKLTDELRDAYEDNARFSEEPAPEHSPTEYSTWVEEKDAAAERLSEAVIAVDTRLMQTEDALVDAEKAGMDGLDESKALRQDAKKLYEGLRHADQKVDEERAARMTGTQREGAEPPALPDRGSGRAPGAGAQQQERSGPAR